ncbi:MAG: chemotaxis protein, partial [Methylococcaceae bacterium]
MTIGKKLIGGYVIVLALLALVAAISFYSLNRLQTTYDRFIDVNERLVNGADELRFGIRDQIAHFRGMLLYPDLAKRFMADLQDDHREFNA